MNDRSISATSALSYLLWAIGAMFVGLSFIGPLQLAAVGLFMAGAGGVAQIRGMFCALHQREREAYALGQESVRSIR